MDIDKILENCKSLSDISRKIFGKENCTNREKCKKILAENGIEWNEWLKAKKEEKKKYCLYCGKELIGDYRKKFCNHSCAASYNNKGVARNGTEKENKFCEYCGKELKNKRSRFCSAKCQKEHEYEEHILEWKNGNDNGWTGKQAGIKPYIKRYLFEKYSCKCEKCGWGEENPITHKIPLQIHHIDGDCKNNREENLQLLCPNCHSLTETFGKLNKKSSRKR